MNSTFVNLLRYLTVVAKLQEKVYYKYSHIHVNTVCLSYEFVKYLSVFS